MSIGFEAIETGLSLADSEINGFTYKATTKNLVIEITKWNADILEYTFFDVLFFRDNQGDWLSDFGENKSKCSLLLEDTIKIDDNDPERAILKLFQFIDIQDNPCFEIICKDFKVEVAKVYGE